MSRVRGKKRMEIIKKFINGEEDPDYEVLPTVTKENGDNKEVHERGRGP